jgi:predicted Na+-dependent transporter
VVVAAKIKYTQRRKMLLEVVLWPVVWGMLMRRMLRHSRCEKPDVAETNLLE